MSVSKLLPSSGSNDFNVAIGGTNTSVTFDKEYGAGAYTIVASGSDTTFDVYAYNAAGVLAGYTNSASFVASIPFNKMVILGHTAGSLLSFNYKKTYTTSADDNEVTAGPFIVSASATTLPNTSSTISVTGGNFATDITATFTSTSTATVYTATVTRNSVTNLTIGRPSTLPAQYGPYSLVLENPGITSPTGSNSHKLTVDAGVAPTWVTGSVLSFTSGQSWNGGNLSATETDAGSTIQYSIVSGTLPSGLSLSTSGVITGTTTASQVSVTFRATDSGNSFTDKTIKFNANPVWVTSGTIAATKDAVYSYSLSTTDDAAGARTYVLTSGTLPTGLTLASNGTISGTPTVYNPTGANVTFTATDADGGSTVSGTITIQVLQVQYATLTSSQSWTVPAGNTTIDYIVVAGGGAGAFPGSNVGGSGGGAGGMIVVTGASVTPGASLSAVIGAGGNGTFGSQSDGGSGVRGGNSSFNGTSCTGGGGGGAWHSFNAGNGGSGGGAPGSSGGNFGTGIAGQGNNGGSGRDQYSACGGGGKGSAGGVYTAGSGYTWIDGITYARGGTGVSNGNNNGEYVYTAFPNRGYGGNGNYGSDSYGRGSDGVVKIKYLG